MQPEAPTAPHDDAAMSAADHLRRDDAAFTELYRREFARTATLARSLCGSWAVAEELAQDAFLVAHRKWAHVGTMSDPGQWVRRVVANRAVSTFHRRAAERRALRRLGPGQRLVDPPSPADAILQRVADLPPKQALAIAAVYIDQLDAAEAAALVGCSPSTLRTHLQRGRAALRAAHESAEAEER
jgi:RNA polymerase sigma factor (sigma-70 family)